MAAAAMKRDPGALAAGLLERGRSEHGDLGVTEDDLRLHLRQLVERGHATVAGLEHAHEDLYLACACLRRDARALAQFRRVHCEHVDAALRYFGLEPATTLDVVQATVEQAVLGPSPAIARYAGRAPLRRWVRSIAVRLGAREAKVATRSGSDTLLEQIAASDDDLDHALLRQRYARPYEEALGASLQGLSARQRDLLAHYYLDGASIDTLAARHRVHRSTAARWIQRARHALLEATLDRLCESLGVSRSEAARIGAQLRSTLHVSIARRLREDR